MRNSELRELLKVSPGTIRADLRELEAQGVLEIVHGGAVVRRAASDGKILLDERTQLHAESKRRIGARAAQMVKSEQTILVDSGTTTIELINNLSSNLDYIQVVTHSFQVAALAARLPNVEVLMPGGMVRAYNMTLVGPQALSFLDTINADAVFLATTGFSVEYGVTNANILEVEVKRKITQRAEKVILITDSSKYGKRQALQVVPMASIDMLITDTDLHDDAVQKLAALSIEVVRV